MPKTRYDSFNIRILHDFQSIPESWRELRMLMYRKSTVGREKMPSDKQVDYAEEFLKGANIRYERPSEQTTFNFRVEEYQTIKKGQPVKRTRLRASMNLIFNGRIYKRGRFIPKAVVKPKEEKSEEKGEQNDGTTE